jgi:hypothetical protein
MAGGAVSFHFGRWEQLKRPMGLAKNELVILPATQDSLETTGCLQ